MERTRQANPRHAANIAQLDDQPRGDQGYPARPLRGRPPRAPARPETSPTPRSGARKDSLEARIQDALTIVAELLEHDEAYVPVFTRLEEELERVQAQRDALSRARAYLRARP